MKMSMKNTIYQIHGCLEKLELNDLVSKYSGYFIVNYDNFEVIYTDGYENQNGMWCYKISDLEKSPEPAKVEQSGEQKQSEGQENSGENAENSGDKAENSANTTENSN